MNRLLIVITLVLTLLGVGLIVLIPAVFAHRPEDPPYWEAFGFGACHLPCWAGITPGVTRFPDAPHLMEDNIPGLVRAVLVSGSQANVWAITEIDGTPYSLAGIIQPNIERVSTVQLTLATRLSPLVSRFGVPACVWVPNSERDTTGLMAYYWLLPDTVVGVLLLDAANNGLTSGSPLNTRRVSAIYLYQRNQNDAICEEDGIVEWRGFAPAWRYRLWRARVKD